MEKKQEGWIQEVQCQLTGISKKTGIVKMHGMEVLSNNRGIIFPNEERHFFKFKREDVRTLSCTGEFQNAMDNKF